MPQGWQGVVAVRTGQCGGMQGREASVEGGRSIVAGLTGRGCNEGRVRNHASQVGGA